MDIGLGWLGVCVGAVGFVALYLLASAAVPRGGDMEAGADRKTAWVAAGFTLGITLIFWAISLQSQPPYSPGQTLGYGFLIGGLIGAAAIAASLRFELINQAVSSVRPKRLASYSTAFLALFGVSLVYSIFHGYPGPALMGFSMGAIMAAILARSSTVGAWAAFAVTIAASTILAVAHFDQPGQRIWWSLPILLATTVCVVGYIGAELASLRRLDTRPGASYVLAALVSSVLLIALTAIYSWRLLDAWEVLWVTLVGLAVGAIIAWLAAGLADNKGGINAGAACVLLLIGFVVVTFKLASGLGIGVGLIAAWTTLLPALSLFSAKHASEDRESIDLGAIPTMLLGSLLLGLSILLLRLFIQQYRSDLGTTDLRIHYTLIGALLGVVVPFVLAPSRPDERTGSIWPVGIAIIGLLAAASPIVLFLLWEIKALMGFVFGLTAAAAFRLLTSGVSGLQPRNELTLPMLILAAQLVAIQFTGPLADTGLTRGAKVWVLVAAAIVGVLWLVISGIVAARRAR